MAPSLRVAEASDLQPFSVGPLKLGMSEAEVLQALGEPDSKSTAVFEQATGLYVRRWLYPSAGLQASFASEHASSDYALQSVILDAPSILPMAAGLKVGMPAEEARSLLDGMVREGVSLFEGSRPEDYAILFEDSYTILSARSRNGRVTTLYLGPGPE